MLLIVESLSRLNTKAVYVTHPPARCAPFFAWFRVMNFHLHLSAFRDHPWFALF